jgi:pSer/pThr/pTyr-binding forkhead associated (FHA) protein
MLVSIIILALAVLCAAIGIWAMRRPSAAESESAWQPSEAPMRMRDTVPAAASSAPGAARPAASLDSQRTVIPQQPVAAAEGPLAILEFHGAPGRVGVLRPEVVIGRHSKDDIRIEDVRVSRHHARLEAKRDGRFVIHNLTADRSEPNPMQVNGETREHADIGDGDVVTLGGVSFTFRSAA